MKKPKLPKRTDGGCIPMGGVIICKPTTTGILKGSQLRLVGLGEVRIPAHMAGVITKYIEALPEDCMLVYQDEITELVKNQLCTWCDGHGWQPVNCMENVVACSHCKGDGLEPPRSRPKLDRITSKTRERMRMILDWRKEGKTLEWIARRLKVTRERVRQLQNMAVHRRWRVPT